MNQEHLTCPSFDCDDLPDSNDAPGALPDSSSLLQYQTVNEISAEARELIASWERARRFTIDYEPCYTPDQLRAMREATGIRSIADMPPPMRYRRVPKNAFMA
jgi:hypothetical protein